MLTQKFVNECFEYRDGILIWKVRPLSHFKDERVMKLFNTKWSGKPAGSMCKGYLNMRLSRFRNTGNHRIIFLMHHGYMPEEVDHINGIPLDNRIENLRAATRAENSRNVSTSHRNTSGRKGVYWNSQKDRWMPMIRVNGKNKYLGLFENIEDAARCRAEAEKKYYGEFSNDR